MKYLHISPERDWHKWFAWYPVTVIDRTDDNDWKEYTVWLDYIERQIDTANGYVFCNYRFIR